MTSTLIDRIAGLNEGVAFKANCRLYSTANLPLTGLSTFEGKTPLAGNRVLVTGQTNAIENGIYIASVGAWSRAPDFDGARDVISGTLVQAFDEGVSDAVIWRVTSPDIIVIDATAITFEMATFAGVDGVISVWATGAVGNDAPDQRSDLQSAHDQDKGIVYYPGKGHYAGVYTAPDPTFYFGNVTTSQVYRVVGLDKSDVEIHGPGIVRGVNRTSPAGGDVDPFFSTAKNMTVGDIKHVTFDDIGFDSYGGALTNTNNRFAYMVGVSGLRYFGTWSKPTGARRGYYSHVQNCENIQVQGHRHEVTTGGFNFRYSARIVITGGVFYDFSEAIDFDGPNRQAIVENMVFEGTTRISQAVDINDMIDGVFGNWCVKNVGNIATINYKTTTPDTFAEYVANSPVRNFQLTKRIILHNIVGSAIGSATALSFYLGWDWSATSHAGANPIEDVTLQNIKLEDHGQVEVIEAMKLTIKGFSSDRAICGLDHAFTMFSQASTPDELGWSDLDVSMDGVRIENSDKGGVSISVASRAIVRGLITRGGNTLFLNKSDLTITAMHKRACRAIVDDCDIEGNVTLNGDSTLASAWASDTIYKRNAIVTNGGLFFKSLTEGRSAASGGPVITGAAWASGTVYAAGAVRLNGTALFICTTGGTSAAAGGPKITGNPWVAVTVYVAGDVRANGSHAFQCTTGGTSAPRIGPAPTGGPWTANHVYTAWDVTTNGATSYQCVTGGTSASSGGPTGTGGAITDGTVTWRSIDPLAIIDGTVVWRLVDALAVIDNTVIWRFFTTASIPDDGSAAVSAWAALTAYVVDDVRVNGSTTYICMTAGTSAASVGPVGTDHRIIDGDVVWRPLTGLLKWEYQPTPYSVRWGKNNRIRGAVTLQGDVAKYVYAEQNSIVIGAVAATGTLIYQIFAARRRMLVTSITYCVTADISVDATNYRSLILKRYRAATATTIATLNITAGETAFIPFDGGVTSDNSSLAPIEPGDMLAVVSNHAGTGAAMSGLAVTFGYMEF